LKTTQPIATKILSLALTTVQSKLNRVDRFKIIPWNSNLSPNSGTPEEKCKFNLFLVMKTFGKFSGVQLFNSSVVFFAETMK
jgi:hypothetical protein